LKEQLRPIIDAVDESYLLAEISRVIDSNNGRDEKAARVAEVIRRAGDYRWVGVYEVTEDEIVNVAFSGPGPPVHPRFPITQGLSGAAVASGETVVAGDVAEDPRYLTAFGSTQSEIIVPVVDSAKRRIPSLKPTAPLWSVARSASPVSSKPRACTGRRRRRPGWIPPPNSMRKSGGLPGAVNP
jgi:putative methionine-R-sulfoxide reductase with GAF domain